MEEVATFLTQYGYLVLFVWVLADQAALPLPAVPILVTAGAFAAVGTLSLPLVLIVASVACLISDLGWYWIGRRHGFDTLNLVCKLSVEPTSCVTRSKSAFHRLGPGGIVVAKYIPGVQTLAPAAAGAVGVPVLGFLALDLLATLLWVVPFVLLGYYFESQLNEVMSALAEVSGGALWFVGSLVALYVLFKIAQWGFFVRQMRVRRIEPEELHGRMQNETGVTIVDLRQRLDFEYLPHVIPGAIRIPIDEIPNRHEEIPRNQDIVLYCT